MALRPPQALVLYALDQFTPGAKYPDNQGKTAPSQFGAPHQLTHPIGALP
jgi:hypothetical protein